MAVRVLRRVRRHDGALGLSPARLSALSALVFGRARTAGELAQAEQVSAPTMTRLLDGLERDGFVTREPSPTDGRSVIVRATGRAAEMLEEGRARRVRELMDLLGDLSDGDWVRLGVAVDLLADALRRDERAGPPRDSRPLSGCPALRRPG
jgi:DNA-binding MarR family transcriptional regulator